MTDSTLAVSGVVADTPERRKHPRSAAHRTWPLIILMIPLTILSWMVSRTGWYSPGVGVGYLLGILGGTFMLLLLLYPLRKRLRLMRSMGPTKHWFAMHMVLGITGPLFILMHSTYRVGSTNALVALTSMLLVAASGLIGRFIYTRIHHGLYGEQAKLKELQTQLEGLESRLRTRLEGFAPIRAMLERFQSIALKDERRGLPRLWVLLTLGVRAKWIELRALHTLTCIGLPRTARARGLEAELALEARDIAGLISTYVGSVVKVAQFSTYQKLFSWWHVLHVPLVYMLVLSAVAHVVAVHIY